jgi:hypothetical protein
MFKQRVVVGVVLILVMAALLQIHQMIVVQAALAIWVILGQSLAMVVNV